MDFVLLAVQRYPWNYFLGISLALLALFLILLVLVQRGRGGGLAGALGGMGGQSAFGTKAGDLFTRVTVGVAAIWILLCMLSIKILNPSANRAFNEQDRTIRINVDGSQERSKGKLTAEDAEAMKEQGAVSADPGKSPKTPAKSKAPATSEDASSPESKSATSDAEKSTPANDVPPANDNKPAEKAPPATGDQSPTENNP